MMTLHQIWLGAAMQPRQQGWCDSMRKAALEAGMEYRLHGWQDVRSEYAGNPVLPLLEAALDALPAASTYALISDWWRLRILADRGGWYADTDFCATATLDWTPEHDLSFFDEGRPGVVKLAAGMMACRGERGRQACAILAEAAERGLLEMMPAPDAVDFAQRYIELVRTDLPGRAFSLVHVIGNAVINRDMLPKVRAAGYTVGAIPHAVASNRRYVTKYGTTAALWHMGCGSWVQRDAAYWPTVAGMAVEYDRIARIRRLPAHLRPQGGVELPELPAVRSRRATDAQEARDALRGVLQAPAGVKRVVVFSNVLQGFPDFRLEPGDWCLHCCRARHLREALTVPGTQHALLIRHGAKMAWYAPDSMDGVHQVCCINRGSPILRRRWYRDYVRDNQGQYPTTGYIAAHLARELLPGVPVVLLGFDPTGDRSTYHWSGHAWSYEAAQYEREGYTIIKPQRCLTPAPRAFAPTGQTLKGLAKAPYSRRHLCKILLGICSAGTMKERRDACRATWLQHPAEGVQPVFFTATATDEPDCVTVQAGDGYDDLPGKVVAFMRYALEHYQFDWLCKVDDDTYCAMDRLPSLCNTDADFIGDRPARGGSHVIGGAGYLMRRAVVQAIVDHAADIPTQGQEDVEISRAVQRLGCKTTHTRRLRWTCESVPTATNDQVTAHLCYPQKMLTIDHTRT